MASDTRRILVTGGAGFIGSAFIRRSLTIDRGVSKLVNLDLLTYAADLSHLASIEGDSRYTFVQGDILDTSLVISLIQKHNISTIVHFAAESHVDRSIEDPRAFYRTNVEGTLSLLEACRHSKQCHFHHVSTDEVYGSIAEGVFAEGAPYRPNSPYAASKAASDHFVRAYEKTYGLSTTISHCGNNFGPCQFPEKLIPKMISQLIAKKPLPVYGDGKNVRDWIYVDDHVDAIWRILEKGKRGETYQIGGGAELPNLTLLEKLIEVYATLSGEERGALRSLITFVPDRPGHDFRYALEGAKIRTELHFSPSYSFEEGLLETVTWYRERAHACR